MKLTLRGAPTDAFPRRIAPWYVVSTKTRTGSSWLSARNRCYNPNVKCYPQYGGSGIRMCKHLLQGPEHLSALIGLRPKRTSLDRIDSRGNYSCGRCSQCRKKGWAMNVRWASAKIQRINQLRTQMITIGGATKCATDWALEARIPFITFYARMKRGWSGPALLLPVLDQSHYLAIEGVTKTVRQWSENLGLRYGTLYYRIHKGWTGDKLTQPVRKTNLREMVSSE